MSEWKPEKQARILINGNVAEIGNDGYRFYFKISGKWKSCLEYKHDDFPEADMLADAMWEAITANAGARGRRSRTVGPLVGTSGGAQ